MKKATIDSKKAEALNILIQNLPVERSNSGFGTALSELTKIHTSHLTKIRDGERGLTLENALAIIECAPKALRLITKKSAGAKHQ